MYDLIWFFAEVFGFELLFYRRRTTKETFIKQQESIQFPIQLELVSRDILNHCVVRIDSESYWIWKVPFLFIPFVTLICSAFVSAASQLSTIRGSKLSSATTD